MIFQVGNAKGPVVHQEGVCCFQEGHQGLFGDTKALEVVQVDNGGAVIVEDGKIILEPVKIADDIGQGPKFSAKSVFAIHGLLGKDGPEKILGIAVFCGDTVVLIDLVAQLADGPRIDIAGVQVGVGLLKLVPEVLEEVKVFCDLPLEVLQNLWRQDLFSLS